MLAITNPTNGLLTLMKVLPLFVIYIVSCVCIFTNELSASEFSIIFVLLYFFSYFYLVVNGMAYASLFSLYLISFGFFVGGRFLYVFINDSILGLETVTTTKLFELDFLTTTKFTYNNMLSTFFLIMSWTILPCIGYILTLSRNKFIYITFSKGEMHVAFYFALFFFIIQLPGQIHAIYTVLLKGYFSLYSEFGLSKINQYAKYLFLLTSAIALIDKDLRRKIFLLFILNGILSGVTGARGTLITLLLSMIFISGLFHRISIWRLIATLLILYLILFLLTYLSPRYSEGESFYTFISDISNFLYSRGGVIGVIGYSIHNVGDVSLPLKLGWFMPGLERIVAILSGIEITPQNESISRFISYSANSSAFYNGQGLGSSIISESYLVTNSYFLACLLSLFVGLTLGLYEKYMRYNKFLFMVVIAISPNIFFSVRDSLDSIYLLAFKFTILSIIINWVISTFSYRYKKSVRE